MVPPAEGVPEGVGRDDMVEVESLDHLVESRNETIGR